MKYPNISPVSVEAGKAAGQFSLISSKRTVRRTNRSLLIASILSLLISVAGKESSAQTIAAAPVYVELNALQLDQLVAPIALDPDPLVAQILTSSTFPDQVSDADRWLSQNLNLTPDQRAKATDGESWDASVKSLVAFPPVLDSMAKNTAWTTQLGNAYFNQPVDVMNAIQAMRLEAQQASVLVTTVHERVVVTENLIEILPVDPVVVYVPYYNPWRIWSALFVTYPGYIEVPPPAGVVVSSAVAFEPAVNVGVYAQFGWGFSAWAPSWGDGTIACNNNTYISNSQTVVNRGHFGGHDAGAFERAGRGVPPGYHAGARAGAARWAGRTGHAGPSFGHVQDRRSASYGRSPYAGQHSPAGRSYAGGNSLGRNTGGPRANPVRHTPAARSYSAMNHAYPSNRTASRSKPAGRYGSSARSTMVGHSTTPARTTGGNRTQAAAGRSLGNYRAPSQSRSYAAGRSMAGPASSGRSFGAGPSMGRSYGANRPANHPASMSNSFGGNRPVNRPASMGNSFGANRSFNRPSSMGNSFSGNRSMSAPASFGRSGGAGSNRAPSAAGRKR